MRGPARLVVAVVVVPEWLSRGPGVEQSSAPLVAAREPGRLVVAVVVQQWETQQAAASARCPVEASAGSDRGRAVAVVEG